MKLTVAAVLLLAGAAILFLFFYWPQRREELQFVAVTIASIAAIYTAYYIGLGLRIQLYHDRITHSFRLLERCHDASLIRYRLRVQELLDNEEIPSAGLVETIKADPELHVGVKTSLNLYEDLAIAIQHGYADEAIIYEDLCTYLPWFLRNMTPFISSIRTQYEDDRLWCQCQKLAGSWGAGKYLFTGGRIVVS